MEERRAIRFLQFERAEPRLMLSGDAIDLAAYVDDAHRAARIADPSFEFLSRSDRLTPPLDRVIPLTFEPMSSTATARFVSRGFGYHYAFADDEVSMHLPGAKGVDELPLPAITMSWLDANESAAAAAAPATHVAHYFLGNEPSDWRTDVSSYERIDYAEVYDGIDLSFYGHGVELEFDWIVAAGADPGQISMSFGGVDEVSINETGELVLSTDAGEVRQRAPYIYQSIDGREVEIEGAFALNTDGTVGFAVGSYDVDHELIIDPQIVYTESIAGELFDGAKAVAVDDEGNAYVTGVTESTLFPATEGAFQIERDSEFVVAWVGKFDSQGNADWITFFGGRDGAIANGIGLNSLGEVWIAGSAGFGLPLVDPLDDTIDGTGADAFLARLSNDGSQLLFSTFWGGETPDGAADLAIGADDKVYITGSSRGGIPLVNEITGHVSGDSNDVFVTQFSADGKQVLFSSYYGSPDDDYGESIAVDHVGHIYIAGGTSGDLVYPAPLQEGDGTPGSPDAFLVKLDPVNAQILYGTALRGTGSGPSIIEHEWAYGVDVYGDGLAAVTGVVANSGMLTTPNAVRQFSPNAGNTSTADNISDAFVTVLDTTKGGLESLVYGTYFGGEIGVDEAYAVAFDEFGNLLLVGRTGAQLDFPLTPNALQYDYGGPNDSALGIAEGFIAKINPFAERSLIYSSYFGGTPAYEELYDVAVDGDGRVTAVGQVGVAGTPFWNAIVVNYDFGAEGGTAATEGYLTPFAKKFVGEVGTFHTYRRDAKPEDFAVTVLWGDGRQTSATNITTSGDGYFSVTAEHTYDIPGAYPITMYVDDRVDDSQSPKSRINVVPLAGYQFAPVLANDPGGFYTYMIADAGERPSDGLIVARSPDGGLTWESNKFSVSNDSLNPVIGSFDATVDSHGDVWVAYADNGTLAIARSTDHSNSFTKVADFPEFPMGPTPGRISIATGPVDGADPVGSRAVWLTFQDVLGQIYVTKARIIESTPPIFEVPELLASSTSDTFLETPDVAVGPDGEAIVIWHRQKTSPPSSMLVGAVADSFTSGFGDSYALATQATSTIPMHPSIVFDRSGGERNGRAYIVYQGEGLHPETSLPVYGLDTMLLDGIDRGREWTAPRRVNSDLGRASQIRPSIDVDQNTGVVGIGWYDNRIDGDQYDFYVAASNDGGESFESEIVLTNASLPMHRRIRSSVTFRSVPFRGTTMLAAWADEATNISDSADDAYDIAVAGVGVMSVPPPDVTLLPFGVEAVENAEFSGLVATFTTTDPINSPSSFFARVDWGDGTATEGLTVTQPEGPGTPFHLTGSHTYANEGAYPISVQVINRYSGGPDFASFGNTTQTTGSESNATIAVDPSNLDRLFMAAEAPAKPGQIVVSVSEDGGATWDSRDLGHEGIPALSRHPRATFDSYGNLYLVVTTEESGGDGPPVEPRTAILTSLDGGKYFDMVGVFDTAGATEPAIAVGPDATGSGQEVWVSHSVPGALEVFAFSATGLGQFGDFRSRDYGFNSVHSDIAFGPKGQVLATWIAPDLINTTIKTAINPDGLGSMMFEDPVTVDDTFLGGRPDDELTFTIREQPHRGISPSPRVAWDHSFGPHRGRAYIVYGVADGPTGPTHIRFAYSDDEGRTWNDPVQLPVFGPNQFHPAIAVDPTSGVVAVSYFTSSLIGDSVQRMVVLSADGGETFNAFPGHATTTRYYTPAFVTNPVTDYNQNSAIERIESGDYGEMEFMAGVLNVAWPTNSTTLLYNPRPADLEIANWQIGVADIYGQELNITFAEDFEPYVGELVQGVIAEFQDLDPDPQDVNDYEAKIDWGDGSVTTGVIVPKSTGIYVVEGEYSYDNPGVYDVSVTISGRRAGTVASITASVEPAPLVPIGQTVRVVEAVEFAEVVAKFDTDNAFATKFRFRATIDWGDGNTSPGDIEFNGSEGLFEVRGTHTYSDEQPHTVTVTIDELPARSGPSGASFSLALAADEPEAPVQTVVAHSTFIAGDPFISVEDAAEVGVLEDLATGLVTLARFQLGEGPVDSHPGAYAATIDWDDGSTTDGEVTIVGREVIVRGEHTYVDGGTYLAAVTLMDDSGGSQVASAVVIVAREITSAVDVNASGLVFNPSTQTYVGNVQVFNNSGVNLTGDFRVVFDNLTPGAILLTASDETLANDPYIKVEQGILFSGNALPAAPLEFSVPDPLTATITYTPRVFAGGQFLGSNLDPAPLAATAGQLAAAFERNIGQTDASVRYLSRGAGYSLYLTDHGAVVRLDGDDHPVVLGMHWVGGDPQASAVGIHPRQGVSHYLIGDRSEWITDAPTFGRVRYQDVYEGIDIELHHDTGALQYDWFVAAGANPSDIALSFAGADEVTVGTDGALRIQVGGESMIHHAPTLYQVIGGNVVAVEGSYVLLDNGDVGFHVGDYDAAHELVIDPVLEYTSYLGGDFIDQGYDVAVDTDGNTIVVGSATGLGFPLVNTLPGSGLAYSDITSIPGNGFVTKIDPQGNLLFSTYFASSAAAMAVTAVEIDPAGNLVLGGFGGNGILPTPDAFQPYFVTSGFLSTNTFVARLDSSGSNVLYASYLGGGVGDVISDLTTDDAGNIYLTGYSNSLQFPTTDGVFQPVHADPERPLAHLPGAIALSVDGFVAKVNADGSLAYSTFLGGVGDDLLQSISVDDAGRAYVVGYSRAEGLPTPGGPNPLKSGGDDAYVAILSADATTVEYGTYLGGSGNDGALGAHLDDAANLRVVGFTQSNDFELINPLPGFAHGGGRDGFIATIDASGALVQSTYYGTEGDDQASAIGLDAAGNVYVVGEVGSSSLPMVAAVQSAYGGGDTDAFVTRFDGNIANIEYATFLGGDGTDRLLVIDVADDGTVSAVGSTTSTNLRTINATQPGLAPSGIRPEADVLIARIAPAGAGTIEVTSQSFGAVEGRAFDGLVGTFTTTGSEAAEVFTATIDWGDGVQSEGVVTRRSNGTFDIAGSHVYERFGRYTVVVIVEHENGTVATDMRTIAAAAAEGFIDYRVSIDTASLAGTSGIASFQFNPALIGGSTPGRVTVTRINLDGGVLAGSPVVDGDAFGAIDDTVTIINGGQLNRLSQALTFGERITFDVRLSGRMLADPLGGLFASTFAVQLFGDGGATPLLTTHSSGAVLSIDVLSDGSTQAMVHEDATGAHAATVATGRLATVIDGSLTAVAVTINALEGVPFTGLVATFTDENPFGYADEFTVVIDWGDGSPASTGTVLQTGVGTFDVMGSHIYTEIGTYEVTATIESIGGFSTQTEAVTSGIAGLQAARTQKIGGDPFHLDRGDFDNDGHLDVVIPAFRLSTTNLNHHASLLFGNGDGTFDDPIEVPAGTAPFDLTIGDYNNDGHLDFITTSTNSYNVILGNGNRTFQAPATYPLTGISRLWSSDINRDGVLDVVVTTFITFVGPGVAPLLGNGDGTFTALPTFTTTQRATVADVNGDGNVDLVETSTAVPNQTFTFRYGAGNGTFGIPQQLTMPLIGNAAFGDMNGDAIADLVINSSGMTHVLLRNSVGQYGAPMSVTSDVWTAVISLVDFDGDGDLDVVAPRTGTLSSDPDTLGGVDLMFNDGTGILTDAIAYPAPARNRDYTIGDFDHNGVQDVAAIVIPDGSNSAMFTVALADKDNSIVAPLRFDLDLLNPGQHTGVSQWDVADLNQDGHFDMVIFTSGRSRTIYAVLNQGDGRFGDAMLGPAVVLPSSLDVEDINQDGIPDLIYTQDRGTNVLLSQEEEGVYLRLGNGDGTFGAESFYRVERNPLALELINFNNVAVGDIDGDGHVDLFASTGRHSKILRGNGDGTFQAPEQLIVGGLTVFGTGRLELIDLNNDGHLDFATPGVFVALGNGDGTFQTATRYFSSPTDYDFEIADVNRDGKVDIVITSTYSDFYGVLGGINVLLGDGTGGFGPAVQYGTVEAIYSELVLADFNADGSLDAAALGGENQTSGGPLGLSVFYNNGDGTYGERFFYEPGETTANLIATGRFDGDLIPDIIVAANRTLTVITSKVAAGGATVGNAPLSVSAHDMNPVSGVAFTANVAAFTDANTFALLGDHSALIDWGDGTSTAGVIIASPVGGYLVQGTHTYAATGLFDVTVTVNDDAGGSAEGNSTANVTAANGAITASPLVFAARESELFVAIVAIFEDNDPLGALGDYAALIQWGDGDSSPGAISINGDHFEVIGSHTYSAGGVYAVTVTVTEIDGGGDTVISTANVEANHTPVAVDDNYAIDEDQTLIVVTDSGVRSNDVDPDGDPLTVTLIDTVDQGALTLTSDGSFIYTPTANFNGLDSFRYSVHDGRGGSAIAVATILVRPVNDAPVAVADGAATDEESAVLVHVLANDSDLDGDTLVVLRTTSPAFGTVQVHADQSITYVPNKHFHGLDTFTYTAFDNAGGFSVAQVEVHVAPVNDKPTARDDLAATLEDTAVDIDVLTNDFDVDGDEVSVIGTSQPANGTVVVNLDGTVRYTPHLNFHGIDQFTYTISDGAIGVSVVGNVNVKVTAVNDRPIAIADEYVTAEDTVLLVDVAGGVLSNDEDPDGVPRSTILVSNVTHGALLLNADGAFVFTPTQDFHGTDQFAYRAVDAEGARSDPVVVALTVTPTNDDPIARDDHAITSANMSVVIDLLGNDTDVDGDVLVISNISPPAKGTATQGEDGTLIYTPHAGESGADVFSYSIDDQQGGQAVAFVRVTINPLIVNTPPVANNDSAATNPGAPVSIAVLANDRDVDGALLIDSLTVLNHPVHGMVTVNRDGTVTYVPNADFAGRDIFSYVVSDDQGTQSNEASVAVTVRPLVSVEAAVPNAYEQGPTEGSFRLRRSGMTDGDLTVYYAVVGTAANGIDFVILEGIAVIADCQNSVIVPVLPVDDMEVEGTESVSLVLRLDHAYVVDSNRRYDTVTITDNDTNAVAVDDNYSTDEDTLLTVVAPGVLANDGDVDGSTLSAALVTDVSHGTLTLHPDGSFEYNPTADFHGTDSFTYTPHPSVAAATVTITVDPVNDLPVAVDDNYPTNEDTPLTVGAPGVLTNDTDIDGDALRVVLVTDVSHGTLTLHLDGSFDYTPAVDFHGADSFIYKAQDPSLVESVETTVTITVHPINDPPVTADDAFTTDANTPLTVVAPGVLDNDLDVDGDPLSVLLVSDVIHGSLTLNPDGSFDYTPAPDFRGIDSFTYRAQDPSLAESVEATVTIIVERIPTALCNLYPIAVNIETLENLAIGAVVSDIFNGSQPGNFGWLTWTGSNEVPSLVKSLTSPGDSHTYVNPDDASDDLVSIGDWVQGTPGVTNAIAVRNALNALKAIDITLPVWDHVQGQGANVEYQIADFVIVRIVDFRLPGTNRISVQYMGRANCQGNDRAELDTLVMPSIADIDPIRTNNAVDARLGSAVVDSLQSGYVGRRQPIANRHDLDYRSHDQDLIRQTRTLLDQQSHVIDRVIGEWDSSRGSKERIDHLSLLHSDEPIDLVDGQWDNKEESSEHDRFFGQFSFRDDVDDATKL